MSLVVLQPFNQKITIPDTSRKLSGKIREDQINIVLNKKRKQQGENCLEKGFQLSVFKNVVRGNTGMDPSVKQSSSFHVCFKADACGRSKDAPLVGAA